MSSFKKLSRSDVSVVPYTANKQWALTFDSFPTTGSEFLAIYRGKNVTGSFASGSDPIDQGQYERLVYTQMNHLFYQQYTASLDTSSLANSIYYESASQQRPTASYFIYNDNPAFVKAFPTGANEIIKVVAVDQSIYGDKILPYTFVISSSAYFVIDDGLGNLYDTAPLITGFMSASFISSSYFLLADPNFESLTTNIGNIMYSHGIAVITNQFYQDLFDTTPFIIAFKNNYTVYENEVRCLVQESDYNLTYNSTLMVSGGQYIVSSSEGYTLTGSIDSTVYDFATGSDFQPYATQLGLYNDNNELLAVAKFGKPLIISPNTDMTFVVKYDI